MRCYEVTEMYLLFQVKQRSFAGSIRLHATWKVSSFHSSVTQLLTFPGGERGEFALQFFSGGKTNLFSNKLNLQLAPSFHYRQHEKKMDLKQSQAAGQE